MPFIALLTSFALFHVAWWDNRVYPLPGKLKTLFKTVIHFVVGVYGNFDTSGYALGIQIPIYTSNSVYNLPIYSVLCTGAVQSLLGHSHAWVQLASCQLLGLVFAGCDQDEVAHSLITAATAEQWGEEGEEPAGAREGDWSAIV